MEPTHNLILSNELNHKIKSPKMGPLCVLIETKDQNYSGSFLVLKL
jgi:hypothetical protein